MTVEIVCPHCGLSKTLEREKIPAGVRWANCPRCKNRFELLLANPIPESGQGGEPVGPEEQGPLRIAPPWERRAELGLWKATCETTKAVLFHPRDLFEKMDVQAGLREPFAFGLLTGALGTMVGLFWQFLVMSGSITSMTRGYLDQYGIALVFTGVLVLSLLLVVVLLFATSLIVHGCLSLVRGGKNGFEATFRVVAYSQAAQILAFIPFVGGLAGLVWQLMVQMIGLKEIHGVSYGRIILAFSIPLVLLLLVLVVVVLTLPFLLLRS
ncbi:MAG: YIP1 family protein [Deltaproteobacteria bacterium]|nr:YIP1 family protein [Deltaproteobacteria bacterium]